MEILGERFVLLFIVILFMLNIQSSLGNARKQQVYSIPLDTLGHKKLYWTVNYHTSRVSFEVHADLSSYGWFALGFSDYGERAPADYCVYWKDWKGHVYLQDTWADSTGRLSVDSSQDCDAFRFTKSNNITKFTFSRQFDTCDSQDYVIEDGTTHIVWACGDGPLVHLSGVSILSPGVRTGMQRTQILKTPAVAAQTLGPEVWPVEVRADAVHVPDGDTTYWCHVQKLPARLNKKHHVVKYESAITPGNEALVHHMEVFHCEAPADEQISSYRGSCFAANRPNNTHVCKRVLAAWAMGATPFSYPEEAGLPIGGPAFNPYVMLELHYNNPDRKSDWVDSSGIRLYVTPKLRKFDGGVIELGLEYTDKMAIPPFQSHFPLTGHCITECTQVGLPPTGIIVFGSQLHTHLTGIRVWTRHLRNGMELPELNRDNHYSTHFQEIRRLKRPVKVLPGDALITTCWFDTKSRANVTLGGHAITDEMCVNYIHYFPKVELEVCKSSISDHSLKNYFYLMNRWERQPTTPKGAISENYRNIEWTPLRARILSWLYDTSPLFMQCNQSSGARFPGDWSAMSITPEPLTPLPTFSRDEKCHHNSLSPHGGRLPEHERETFESESESDPHSQHFKAESPARDDEDDELPTENARDF